MQLNEWHVRVDRSPVFSFQDLENDLITQANRVHEIRHHVQQQCHSSSQQELRTLVNRTSNHVQNLCATSKNYSDKYASRSIVTRPPPCSIVSFRLDAADAALNLLNNLTSQIIELETRLVSQTALIDDEDYIHRQLSDLHELNIHFQTLEKSVKELLRHSEQLSNERLTRISEQLATRWKRITSEIYQR